MNNFDWERGFVLDFDLISGLSQQADTTKRRLSQMKGMFYDQTAYEQMLEQDDPLIYEFYELGCPERPGEIAFGSTILYPGTVGDEFFMTKGHFHTDLMTAEVYYTLSGKGCMLLENMKGDWRILEMKPGQAVYVPRGYAHRTVNTGDQPLIVLFAFDADAGHDYGTIETKGYRQLVVKGSDGVQIVPNPKWQNHE